MTVQLGQLLRECRESTKMSQPQLATCIYGKNHFESGSNVTEPVILKEVRSIEKNNAWTLTGQNLRAFWNNAFQCLKSANPWALCLLVFMVLPRIPDLRENLVSGMPGPLPSTARALVEILHPLDRLNGRRRLFRWFSRSRVTLRTLRALSTGTSDNAKRSQDVVESGWAEIERNIAYILEAARRAAHNDSSAVLVAFRQGSNGTADIQITLDDIDTSGQALLQWIDEIRKNSDHPANT